jgi:hypothetical protein
MRGLSRYKVLIGALVMALLSFPGLAFALQLNSVDITWSNPLGPGAGIIGNVVNPFVEAGAGLITDPIPRDITEVRWGTASPASADVTKKSGLGLDPFFPPPAVVPIGTNFQIGTLFHFNNPILLGTELTSVDITLHAVFQNPPDLTTAAADFSFRFTIDETPNFPPSGICAEGGAPPCRDAIRVIPLDVVPHVFTLGGETFTLILVGFGSGITTGDVFFSDEGATNSTPLIALVTVPGVPNPGSLLLIGFGLIGLAGLSRIRSRRS